MSEEPIFKFAVDFDTKNVILQPIGRFVIGDSVAKIFFGPRGIVMMIPQSALNDKSIVIFDDTIIEFCGSAGVERSAEAAE
jgi:hypothetical protein